MRKQTKRTGRRLRLLSVLFAAVLLAVPDYAVYAASSESALESVEKVSADSTLADGIYSAVFDTDSGMFRVNEAKEGLGVLTVKNGEMTIHISLVSKKILNLYPGLAEDAEADPEHWLEPTTDTVTYDDGYTEEVYGFDVPVPALEEEFSLALIGTKGIWYDHLVSVSEPVFLEELREESLAELPETPEVTESFGEKEESGAQTAEAVLSESQAEEVSEEVETFTIEVTLEGGSGKATVETPAIVRKEDGLFYVQIVWSSPNYDYMMYDGEKYLPVNTEGNSVFELPVSSFAEPVSVQADTVAMSKPYLIDYTLYFDETSITEIEGGSAEADSQAELPESTESADSGDSVLVSEITRKADDSENAAESGSEDAFGVTIPVIGTLAYLSTDENDYARCFRILRYEQDYALLAVDDGRQYLIVPEGASVPEEIDSEIIVIRKPLQNIYLAASAVMCHFDSLQEVEKIALSGTKAEDWYIDAAREAMEAGTLLYGGKYSAPDYELITAMGIDLAIESTMILHEPKVQEKLELLGIPVLIDRSSYEEEPLGRMEWIRVYGLLTGREEEAEAFVKEQIAAVQSVAENTESDAEAAKTVAVFSVNGSGKIVTRRADDYFAKMIVQAGGVYTGVPTEGTDTGSSTMTVSVEDFYAAAKDADILIYNASIVEAPDSMQELLEMCPILAEFRAVQNGEVWCTDNSFYQHADLTGVMIGDLHRVLTGEGEAVYFYRLAS